MPESASPAPSGGPLGTAPTIEEAARTILLDVAPEDVRFLPLACADFFGNPAARRRAVRATLRGRERDQPTGFATGEGMQLVLGVVLTLLNGVACEVLTGMATERVDRLRAGWRDRRRRRALTSSVAPQAERTPLPRVSAVDAAAIGRQAADIVRAAGLPEEAAQRVGTLLAAALIDPRP
ncbi:hypothetical protein DMB42_29280 [Nonomuraea sp. WAC 01424]|uniref:hypothetical protein n=1 Tax=Nonomuraea sp. WAC 01424 TaxID=2203200 RepID=UPI000F78182C|nr:hypothetical protein [Nonomuraea sp. WAC 01424]RSN04888.1 hypothetical protein DMB42_29280 [Nonomuraea sp. WAC 01424]